MLDTPSLEEFVSSIKIKGLQFLPPVITAKRRTELQRYKQQAIKLERRLEKCRDLKNNLQKLILLQCPSEYNHSSESDSIFDADNSFNRESCVTEFPVYERKPKLSVDIVDIAEYGRDGIKIIDKVDFADVTEYSEDGIKMIDGEEKAETNIHYVNNIPSRSPTGQINNIENNVEETSAKLNDKKCQPENCYLDILESIETNLNNLESIIEPFNDKTNSFSSSNTPPKLIRSNSYILENPSPILLAHLDKFGSNEDKDTILIDRTCSPCENFHCDGNNIKSGLNNIHVQTGTDNSTSKIEVIQTDISTQHITVDSNTNICEETETQKSTLELVDPECQLLEVLKSIPEDYSKRILELIEKQQRNNNNVLKSYEVHKEITNTYGESNGSSDHLLENQKQPNLFNTISDSDLINLDYSNDYERLSVSPSQSLQFTLSSTCTILPTTPLLHAYESHSDSKVEDIGISKCGQLKNSPTPTTNKEKQTDKQTLNKKKEWAAGVIGAHVKGYLTRRLLKTERVQSLINTIKDALICALQLHTAENIDESDVELHRRLINQVTAACYAFHDIFFSLPVHEQMSIISTDRRRKLEKAKRPASAPVPRRNSTSSTKFRPRTTLSQSTTKV